MKEIHLELRSVESLNIVFRTSTTEDRVNYPINNNEFLKVYEVFSLD